MATNLATHPKPANQHDTQSYIRTRDSIVALTMSQCDIYGTYVPTSVVKGVLPSEIRPHHRYKALLQDVINELTRKMNDGDLDYGNQTKGKQHDNASRADRDHR